MKNAQNRIIIPYVNTASIIPRELYQQQIAPLIGKRIIKVFSGQRRVGKSCLMEKTMQDIGEASPETQIVHLNLEAFPLRHLKDAEALYAHLQAVLEPGRPHALFLDEIQEVRGFELVLRSYLQEPGNDIYITGSNAALLSGELGSKLTGRFAEIRVRPLVYAEFLEFHGLQDSEEAFFLYERWGGMPFLREIGLREPAAANYLQDTAHSILMRDVLERYSVRHPRHLENLAIYLADITGSPFSATALAKYFKNMRVSMDRDTVQAYVDYMVNAMLVQRAEVLDVHGRQLCERGGKFYFSDHGMRNVVAAYSPSERGKVLENMLHTHLQAHGYKVYVGAVEGKEVDFVAERNDERLYLQCAMSLDSPKTLAREFGNLEAIRDNYPKYVVTLSPYAGPGQRGIHCLSARKFLLSVR